MDRKLKTRVALPYCSSYEHDRRPLSKLIVLLRETKERGQDVQVEDISRKEIDRIDSLDRWTWYGIGTEVGLFSLPPKPFFDLYKAMYEQIKQRFNERVARMPAHPYWRKYFYSKDGEIYRLLPEQEVFEILRSMVCPVFDDIKKELLEKDERKKKFEELISMYKKDFTQKYPWARVVLISHKMLVDFMHEAGYGLAYSQDGLSYAKEVGLRYEMQVVGKKEERRFNLAVLLKEHINRHNGDCRITLTEFASIAKKFGFSASYIYKRGYRSLLLSSLSRFGLQVFIIEKENLESKQPASLVNDPGCAEAQAFRPGSLVK